jgi:phosphoribosylformylglycinamidine synthase subunit PurS
MPGSKDRWQLYESRELLNLIFEREFAAGGTQLSNSLHWAGRQDGVFLAMKARITVTLKNGVLDPQGRAIAQALHTLGFASVEEVRQGKLIEILLKPGDEASARSELDAMCRTLLANPVIENYQVEFLV